MQRSIFGWSNGKKASACGDLGSRSAWVMSESIVPPLALLSCPLSIVNKNKKPINKKRNSKLNLMTFDVHHCTVAVICREIFLGGFIKRNRQWMMKSLNDAIRRHFHKILCDLIWHLKMAFLFSLHIFLSINFWKYQACPYPNNPLGIKKSDAQKL